MNFATRIFSKYKIGLIIIIIKSNNVSCNISNSYTPVQGGRIYADFDNVNGIMR